MLSGTFKKRFELEMVLLTAQFKQSRNQKTVAIPPFEKIYIENCSSNYSNTSKAAHGALRSKRQIKGAINFCYRPPSGGVANPLDKKKKNDPCLIKKMNI